MEITPTVDQKSEVKLHSLTQDDTRMKIRTMYMDGKTIKQILKILNIAQGTWDNYYYTNHKGLREFVDDVRKSYLLTKTESVSKSILDMNAKKSPKLLAIQQKEAEFVRETLGKDKGYSKRIETIGVQINKNEPLTDEQKANIDRVMKRAGAGTLKDVEVVEVAVDQK